MRNPNPQAPTHFNFRFPWALRVEAEIRLYEGETLAAYLLKAIRAMNDTRPIFPGRQSDPLGEAIRKVGEAHELLNQYRAVKEVEM